MISSFAFFLPACHDMIHDRIDNAQADYDGDQTNRQIESLFLNHNSTSEQQMPGIPLPLDFMPAPYTVVIGKSKNHSTVVGNQRLRVLATASLSKYSGAKTKKEKSSIVSSLVKAVRDACPVGAFVKFQDGRFWDVNDHVAREKVGYVLRDLLHSKYKSSAKSKLAKRKLAKDRKVPAAKKDQLLNNVSEHQQKAPEHEAAFPIEPISRQCSEYASIDNGKQENENYFSVGQSFDTRSFDQFMEQGDEGSFITNQSRFKSPFPGNPRS